MEFVGGPATYSAVKVSFLVTFAHTDRPRMVMLAKVLLEEKTCCVHTLYEPGLIEREWFTVMPSYTMVPFHR